MPTVAALAPTPAVAGEPRTAALDLIRQLEPAARGWYAGPIGWVEPEAACFAVAIRSGLLSGDRLALHAGAGIVPGSHPDREWHELEAKLGAFLAALALTPPVHQPTHQPAPPQPALPPCSSADLTWPVHEVAPPPSGKLRRWPHWLRAPPLPARPPPCPGHKGAASTRKMSSVMPRPLMLSPSPSRTPALPQCRENEDPGRAP
jgi:hypothetical protein